MQAVQVEDPNPSRCSTCALDPSRSRPIQDVPQEKETHPKTTTTTAVVHRQQEEEEESATGATASVSAPGNEETDEEKTKKKKKKKRTRSEKREDKRSYDLRSKVSLSIPFRVPDP